MLNYLQENQITKENYHEKFSTTDKLFKKFEKYMKSLEEENLIDRSDLRKSIHKNYGSIQSWVKRVLDYKKISPSQINNLEHFDYCLLIIIDMIGFRIMELILQIDSI